MNERMLELYRQAQVPDTAIDPSNNMPYETTTFSAEKFAELILANADELKRMMNTDPINKTFELNPKFVAKCDEIGRSRRQFQ